MPPRIKTLTIYIKWAILKLPKLLKKQFRVRFRDSDGKERYKARNVTKGYSQIPNIDYKDTFCPTSRITSIRMLLQIAMHQNLKVHQMDVKTAFLNGPINCELYVEQPKGFGRMGTKGKNLVCKLTKSLYLPETKWENMELAVA